jgi:hypothetical protein
MLKQKVGVCSETHGVFHEVGTEFLNIVQRDLVFEMKNMEFVYFIQLYPYTGFTSCLPVCRHPFLQYITIPSPNM